MLEKREDIKLMCRPAKMVERASDEYDKVKTFGPAGFVLVSVKS